MPLTAWEIDGRLAMRAADEGWHASLRWVRRQDRHAIDLAGPLGGGYLRLTQDRHGAQLRDAEQHVYHARDARALLLRATGWDMPIDGLNYWVLGLPAPGSPVTEDIDPWGRLKTLHQLGWDVEFIKYARYGRYELPSKLFIRRKPSADTLELRMVINRWVLDSQPLSDDGG